jgi:hypothetical protein
VLAVKVETPPSSSDSGLPARWVSSQLQAPLALHPEKSSHQFPSLSRSLRLLPLIRLLLLLLIRRTERQPILSKEGGQALLRERFLSAAWMRNVARRGSFLDLWRSFLHRKA